MKEVALLGVGIVIGFVLARNRQRVENLSREVECLRDRERGDPRERSERNQ